MKYICTNCNYIYDESMGDKEEGINPGTCFWNLGDNFCCPNCYENKDYFHEIIEEINYINEDNSIDLMENEHFIKTEIRNGKVNVEIGKELHPSGDEHRITEIILVDEYGDIIESKFIKKGDDASCNFDISYIDDFEIRARCSLHGLWAKKIKS